MKTIARFLVLTSATGFTLFIFLLSMALAQDWKSNPNNWNNSENNWQNNPNNWQNNPNNWNNNPNNWNRKNGIYDEKGNPRGYVTPNLGGDLTFLIMRETV